MKKTIAILLCLTMLISLLLVGCGDDKKTSGNNDGNTITIGIPRNATIDDYDTNAFTVWLEETTGINIEFQFFAANQGDYSSQLSTMIAGEEKLPDMLWNFSLGNEVYRQYGDYGYFLDLASYYNDPEKGKPFWDRVAELPEEMQEAIEEGLYEPGTENIYGLPMLQNSYLDSMSYQIYINQKWLDKLGLDMPTDNESLYNVLKAFVNNDPNGNGKKDEIGIIGSTRSMGSDAINWLENLFVNTSSEYWWNVDESGQLYLPMMTDEYREGLIYINKLVSEGLMPDTCWSMGATELTPLLNPSDGVNKVGIWAGHPTLVLKGENEAHKEYVALPGWGYQVKKTDTVAKTAFITADCENPDLAWEVYLAMTSEEGALRQRYGEKGVDWDDADEGTKSYIGIDAQIKVLNPYAYTTGNQTWHAIKATLLEYPEDEATQMGDGDDYNSWRLRLVADTWSNFTAQREALPEVRMPHTIRTQEQSAETEIERDNVQNWISSMSAKFATGKDGADPSDDKQWKEYLDEFDKIGYETWRKQAQTLYDEQYK